MRVHLPRVRFTRVSRQGTQSRASCGAFTAPGSRLSHPSSVLSLCSDDCGFVLYKNPVNVVGTLCATPDGRVLLARRGIEPRKGYWNIPGGELLSEARLQAASSRYAQTSTREMLTVCCAAAFAFAGFMELGESVEEGAMRELREEADARPTGPTQLLAVYSIPRHGQVHMFFRATLDERHVSSSAASDDTHAPRTCHGRGDGAETLETRLFSIAEIPWGDLAFPITAAALRHHVAHPLAPGAGTPPPPVDVQTFVPYSVKAASLPPPA